MKIEVRDYDLLNNIDMLYEAPIIIYGAGYRGKEILKILEGLETDIYSFCDVDRKKQELCGYPVLNIENISGICEDKKYIFVLASDIYFDEMKNELDERNISAGYVFTAWAVEAVLNLNLNNSKLSKVYLESYINKTKNYFDEKNRDESLKKLKEYFSLNPQILIYQMGKVGSSSVYRSLKTSNVKCMHVHTFHGFDDNQTETKLLYEKFQNQIKNQGIKIISMIREPIGLDISTVMQEGNFQLCNIIEKNESLNDMFFGNIKHKLTEFSCPSNKLKNQENFNNYKLNFVRLGEKQYFPWFHDELEHLTGINIFEYPFDKENGYSIIKKDKIELLVLTMENLDNNQKTIAEFAELNNFVLMKYNVGSNKAYKYFYNQLKIEIKISEEILDYYYKDNIILEHFYTKSQIEKFRNRWSGKK